MGIGNPKGGSQPQYQGTMDDFLCGHGLDKLAVASKLEDERLRLATKRVQLQSELSKLAAYQLHTLSGNPSPCQWGSIRTARAPRPHRVRYLNNFPRRWSTGRGVVNGTWWALMRYHSP